MNIDTKYYNLISDVFKTKEHTVTILKATLGSLKPVK